MFFREMNRFCPKNVQNRRFFDKRSLLYQEIQDIQDFFREESGTN